MRSRLVGRNRLVDARFFRAWLPGAGRRAVAADDLPAGAADLAGAVRVHGQDPAQLVQHHVVHRADGGRTSLAGLKGYCWWHHHVVLHELGWALTVHPDGTSQVRSPGGKIIRSHSPPPRPG